MVPQRALAAYAVGTGCKAKATVLQLPMDLLHCAVAAESAGVPRRLRNWPSPRACNGLSHRKMIRGRAATSWVLVYLR